MTGASSGSAARVRRIRADEADTLRTIRLRALEDTPLAFGSTHAREAAYAPEHWERWARDGAAGEREAWFLAEAAVGAGAPAGPAEAPVGLASAVIDADDPTTAYLFSMWVAPEARGSGVATALVDAAIAWTTAGGATTLKTSVTLGNEPAAGLYARAGFEDTGRREPLGHSDATTALLERRVRSAAMRAFPVLYARDVERVAGFYAALGFAEHARLPGADGRAGFIGLRRDGAELAVTTEDSPRMLAGIEPGPGPRHELFVYVDDVDRSVAAAPAAGGRVLREAADMPWGERVGFVADPEGNVVSLAARAAASS